MSAARKAWDSPGTSHWLGHDRDILPISRVAVLGPARHVRALLEWSRIFSARGHVVFSPTLWAIPNGQNHRGVVDDPRCLERLLDVLRCANTVFIVDLDEDLGSEFASAIQELTDIGIEIRRLSWEYPHWTERDCEYLSAEELRVFSPSAGV